VLEPFNPLIFKRKTMEIIVPISVKLTPESQALIDALTAMGKAASAPTATAAQPAIGAPWRGGKYAGISVGEDGQPDGYIILLADKPDAKLTWQGSLDWAKTLVDARLPTKREAALLYANLSGEFDTSDWHWTSTPYSGSNAWMQFFDGGSQSDYLKSSERVCRAVRRFPTSTL
jgi:hypothetical protein